MNLRTESLFRVSEVNKWNSFVQTTVISYSLAFPTFLLEKKPCETSYLAAKFLFRLYSFNKALRHVKNVFIQRFLFIHPRFVFIVQIRSLLMVAQ